MSAKEDKYSSFNLNQGAEIFSSWRCSRVKGERIPKQLWELAISLCEKYSISKVSLALKLSHACLKKKCFPESKKNTKLKKR